MPDQIPNRQISELSAEKRPVALTAKLFVVALCVLLLALQINDAWRARQERLARVAQATANMTHALAAQGQSTLGVVDTVLAGMTERIERDGMQGAAYERLRAHLHHMGGEIEELHGLFVFGADGDWLLATHPRKPPFTSSDREYFQHHLHHPGRQVYIGKPIKSRSNNAWVLPISRRLEQADGSFAGIVLATVRIDYFSKLYASFDVGAGGTILLMRSDGTLIYRLPYNDSLIGNDMSSGPVHQMYRKEGPIGTAMMRAKVDNIERLYSYRHFETYPLIVATAQAKDDVLSDWWKSTLNQLALVLLAVLAFVGVGWRLVRQITIRDHLEVELRQARAALQQRNEELAVLADHDGLTGIANRRRFEQALQLETARATRTGAPLSLLMLDVDHFKRYNDTYGHVAGDQCLRKVAALLGTASERPADLAARYGGEEFVVLLPETDAVGADLLAHRIREHVAQLRIPHAANGPGVVTISAGAYTMIDTSIPDAGSILVERADALLYEAKLKGRNRVCSQHGEAEHLTESA